MSNTAVHVQALLDALGLDELVVSINLHARTWEPLRRGQINPHQTINVNLCASSRKGTVPCTAMINVGRGADGLCVYKARGLHLVWLTNVARFNASPFRALCVMLSSRPVARRGPATAIACVYIPSSAAYTGTTSDPLVVSKQDLRHHIVEWLPTRLPSCGV